MIVDDRSDSGAFSRTKRKRLLQRLYLVDFGQTTRFLGGVLVETLVQQMTVLRINGYLIGKPHPSATSLKQP